MNTIRYTVYKGNPRIGKAQKIETFNNLDDALDCMQSFRNRHPEEKEGYYVAEE